MKKQIIFFCITMLVVALLGGISVAQATTYYTASKTYGATRALNGNYIDALDQSYEGQGAMYSLVSVVELTGKTATTTAQVPAGNVTLPGADNFYVTVIVESNKGYSTNDTARQNAAGGTDIVLTTTATLPWYTWGATRTQHYATCSQYAYHSSDTPYLSQNIIYVE